MSIKLNKVAPNIYEIPKSGGMQVPGRIFASDKLIDHIRNDNAAEQVANVAYLPGIVKFSMAMPDIHWGYGFPIGGVAATRVEDGVISPGGVGYDINCGVRLVRTDLTADYIRPRIKPLLTNIFNNVPSGVGSSGAIKKLSEKELKNLLVKGAGWAIENGFGESDDLNYIEDQGQLKDAIPDYVSSRALKRGLSQPGTLGSGNHFVEVSEVKEIFDPSSARIFGLHEGQIVVQIHTGSRGFGYQVCDDYIKTARNAAQKYNIQLPDRQLVCAPVQSEEGQQYIGAMRCAANYAFNNRQVIASLIKDSLLKALQTNPSDLGFKTVWDIAHNIAKIETHQVDGQEKELCVHRKGATRAFGPGNPVLPDKYQETGQPVLIPGDMGTASYVCAGTDRAMEMTFGSSCHGAGRVMSRRQAKKESGKRKIFKELEDQGILVMAQSKGTVAEEMPFVYKNVGHVVQTMHDLDITRKVARLVPIGVIKG
ncbi:MAG TPA: RtcB family protein [bacterium]|nr:RtcB family protein [bacterium]